MTRSLTRRSTARAERLESSDDEDDDDDGSFGDDEDESFGDEDGSRWADAVPDPDSIP